MNKYEDIINISRPISKHPPMSLNNRSAQFAPFSALTGYSEKIKEVARITNPKIELSDEEKLKINDKINWVKENIKENPKITITYFVQDKKKSGGQYKTRKCEIGKSDSRDIPCIRRRRSLRGRNRSGLQGNGKRMQHNPRQAAACYKRLLRTR